MWSEPSDWLPARFGGQRSSIWYVAKALSDMGAFSRAGLDIVSHVWSAVDFIGEIECFSFPQSDAANVGTTARDGFDFAKRRTEPAAIPVQSMAGANVSPRFKTDSSALGGSSSSAAGSIAERDRRPWGLLADYWAALAPSTDMFNFHRNPSRSSQSAFHPSMVINGPPAESQKRRGGFRQNQTLSAAPGSAMIGRGSSQFRSRSGWRVYLVRDKFLPFINGMDAPLNDRKRLATLKIHHCKSTFQVPSELPLET